MRIKIKPEYLEKIAEKNKQHKQVLNQKKDMMRRSIYFKGNALNGGDIDYQKTLSYSNI